jgi:hypothetical protein
MDRSATSSSDLDMILARIPKLACTSTVAPRGIARPLFTSSSTHSYQHIVLRNPANIRTKVPQGKAGSTIKGKAKEFNPFVLFPLLFGIISH